MRKVCVGDTVDHQLREKCGKGKERQTRCVAMIQAKAFVYIFSKSLKDQALKL